MIKPKIEQTAFGSITINGDRFEHDVVIDLDGRVRKRRKKLSKQVYGTSHTISINEAKDIYEKDADLLIIGTGQYDQVILSPEAEIYFKKKNCPVKMLATPEACHAWNETKNKKTIGLFHVTC
jgi:hypothetical protein